MDYTFILEVESELDEKVIRIEALTLESLEEQLGKVEKAIKAYEIDKEVQAQAEYDRQREEREI